MTLNSIRLRLLLSLIAMLALAALAMGALTYRSVLAEAEAQLDYQLTQMALSLRDQGSIASAQADTLENAQLDFVIQIWTVDGRSIYASRAHTDLPARALIGLADITTANGETWRTYSVATHQRVIQVAQPVRIRERLATAAALRTVAPLLFIAPLLALVIWWIASLTLAPLQRVAADVRRRDIGSLQPLPTERLPDEVSTLVAALNALLQRLASSLDTQRAFVADAAHELRSPLTALKLQMQLLQRAPDDAGRAEAIAALTAGIDRAARLVEQLLALARNDPGVMPATSTPVDLSEVARQAVADTLAFAATRDTRVALFAEAPVRVVGDATALQVLVRNLVDNAVRYAPNGARVDVRLRAGADNSVTLLVDDSGAGIPAAERERVFDRFYRRANADVTGSGLGLAIVRNIAERHGAEVAIDESPLGGTRVEVRFATATTAPSGGVAVLPSA